MSLLVYLDPHRTWLPPAWQSGFYDRRASTRNILVWMGQLIGDSRHGGLWFGTRRLLAGFAGAAVD